MTDKERRAVEAAVVMGLVASPCARCGRWIVHKPGVREPYACPSYCYAEADDER